jgi:hypothetical protein
MCSNEFHTSGERKKIREIVLIAALLAGIALLSHVGLALADAAMLP